MKSTDYDDWKTIEPEQTAQKHRSQTITTRDEVIKIQDSQAWRDMMIAQQRKQRENWDFEQKHGFSRY